MQNISYPYVSNSKPEDFFSLLKPRVMSLVIFTTLVGFSFYVDKIHPFLMLICLLSIALGAGASGALNMWYDADIDCKMERTAKRPIPYGKISSETARDFGIILSLISIITLFIASNFLAAFLLAFTIFFYAVIYTMWLKRSTQQNIVIGGIAGALPPLIAGAAATGSITTQGVILCSIIFLWTPPHFWSLALVKKNEYQKANIPMMPNVSGDKKTINQIMIYWIMLFVVSFIPVYFNFGDIIYLTIAIILGLIYGKTCIDIKRNYGINTYNKKCLQSFGTSIIYLFILFLSLLVEQMFMINII